jgi:hypothetical protein
MTYILVNKKRFARVWNIQPSEHWPFRKWILKCVKSGDMSGWPAFWWMWRLQLSIDSDVYSDGKRIYGWMLALICPWAGLTIHWKHPNVMSFMTRETSAEFSWKHPRRFAYKVGDLFFRETRKRTWRTWSFENRLTQVKLVDIR